MMDVLDITEAWLKANGYDAVKTICKLTPIGKPRMTRADKWKKRKCVLKYRQFADDLRESMAGIDLSKVGSVSWKCFFPLTESWSAKKKAAMSGAPHQQKPDRDNIDKAILDSLFADDSGIYHGVLEKIWDDGGGPRIEITLAFRREDEANA